MDEKEDINKPAIVIDFPVDFKQIIFTCFVFVFILVAARQQNKQTMLATGQQ
jgi:hypothetical protein